MPRAYPPPKKNGVVVVGGISKEKQIKISCENNLNITVLELVSDCKPSTKKLCDTEESKE